MKMPNRACTSRYLAAAISTQPKCHVAATTVVASTASESSLIREGTVSPAAKAETTGHHHEHDRKEEMVHMHATLGHDAAGPPRHAGTAHQAGGEGDEPKRAHKADQGQEEEPAFVEASPRFADHGSERAVHGQTPFIDLASPICAGAASPRSTAQRLASSIRGAPQIGSRAARAIAPFAQRCMTRTIVFL